MRTGGDYGVTASVENATQVAGLLSSQVTLWGVPGDPRHDQSRGWECVDGGVYASEVGKPCPTSSALPQEAFLTLPTSCAANPSSEPLSSSVRNGLLGAAGELRIAPAKRVVRSSWRTTGRRRLRPAALHPFDLHGA